MTEILSAPLPPDLLALSADAAVRRQLAEAFALACALAPSREHALDVLLREPIRALHRRTAAGAIVSGQGAAVLAIFRDMAAREATQRGAFS